MIWPTCRFTVSSEMPKVTAISLLARPWAIWARISRSRGVMAEWRRASARRGAAVGGGIGEEIARLFFRGGEAHEIEREAGEEGQVIRQTR